MKYKLCFINILIFINFFIVKSFLKAANFNSIYFSSQTLGRGNTHTASAKLEDKIIFNPALLGIDSKQQKNRFVLLSPSVQSSANTAEVRASLSGSEQEKLKVFRTLIEKPATFSIANYTGYISGAFAIGFVSSTFLNLNAYKDIDKSGLETFEGNFYENYMLIGSYGFNLGKYISYGINLKGISRKQASIKMNLADIDTIKSLDLSDFQKQSTAVGADFGFLVRAKVATNPVFAVSVLDIGGTKFKSVEQDLSLSISHYNSQVEPINQSINVGLSLNPSIGRGFAVLSADFHDLEGNEDDNNFKRLHLGAQYLYKNGYGFALGFNQGYPSASFLIRRNNFSFVLGRYTEETGKSIGYKPDIRYFTKISLII